MKYQTALSIFASCSALLGCALAPSSYSNLRAEEPLPGPNESIIVFGTNATRMWLYFSPGAFEPEDRVFTPSAGSPLIYTVPSADEPYVAVRVPANTSYVLGKAQSKDGWATIKLSFCRKTQTLGFTAPAGKVLYVGNMQFIQLPKESAMSLPTYKLEYVDDFEGARKFMRSHYPALVPALESGEGFVVGETKGNCWR
ncbi:hypothetical protein [Amantichitinum ursilacus]|uniref:DUF2846 domain-containing protein n=1 Tax=Amantichitinum ursilacus TaxID=857265 RepID=A0A0N0GN84_9NEIS|nr:hypothetical protein [Amantichitinum ursilacus]KPC52552.1 hypothetical protein WG78_11930 [Amantichitinum ursilacus]